MQEGDDTLLLPSVRELLQKTPQSRAPLPHPRPELPLSKRRKVNEGVRAIPSPNADDPEIFTELVQLKANIVEVISDHRQLSSWKDVGADALEEALLSATSTPAKKQAYSAAPSAHGQEQNIVDAILIETSSRLDRILFAEKSLRSKIAAFIHHELITTVSTSTAN